MLFEVSIESYLFFKSILAVAILSTCWAIWRREKSFRKRFLSLYDIKELRSNPYRVDSIYQIVETRSDSVLIVPIWNSGKPVLNGSEYEFDPKNLAPFDRDRFIAGQ